MNNFYIAPANLIRFGDNQGELIINDSKLRFEGDAEESAKILFDMVVKTFNEHIKQAVLNEREACAKLCDELKWNGSPFDCATEIRARGKI